jgi:hypothetical protein
MLSTLVICFICTIFPSLDILQHYVEFGICTIVTLEKLLGVRSFGNFIGHLTHHQAILPTSSEFSHLSMV